MRLMVVQYSGDFRKVFFNVKCGAIETYHAHQYLVSSLEGFAERLEEVTMLFCHSAEPHDELLQPGVRAVGAGFDPYENTAELCQVIAKHRPTHLVLQVPAPGVLRWASQQGISVMALLADSFYGKGLGAWRHRRRLVQALNYPQVEWVGNHGINACSALKSLGVKPEKLLPWDWPHGADPHQFPAKQLPETTDALDLLYVGSICLEKGVGDAIEALAALHKRGWKLRLKIAGGGDSGAFKQQALALGIAPWVDFLGVVAQSDIRLLMRESAIVLVPSWHRYGEGLPLTIYESFSVRTPIISSDHPMFRGNVMHGVNGLVVPERNPLALSQAIERLLQDANLYAQLSQATAAAWQRLQIPAKWADLIQRWLDSSPENHQWLEAHRLISGRYDDRIHDSWR